MGTQNNWNNQIAAANSAITLNAGTNTIGVGTDATNNAINVGTGAGIKTTIVGSTNSTSPTTLQSGSGALAVTATGGTLTINSGTGALGISTDASATTCNFATGAAVKTVQLGTTNTTSATVIKSGTGNIAMNSGLTVDSTGRMYNTVQPAFSAYPNGNYTNVTGDGTTYTLGTSALTELYDQGANLAANGTFTAPISGKYLLTNMVLFQGVISTAQCSISINTTLINFAHGNTGTSFTGNVPMAFSIVAKMTAGDTAVFTVTVGNMTKIVGIYGADPRTVISGCLLC